MLIIYSFGNTPPPRQLFFQYENSVWWGTDFGLNRFQTENEILANIRPEPVTDLCLDEKVLWVGTKNGIFYADLRYLDWKSYNSKSGIPSDTIVKIAADLDYVYAASPHGIARFNKLVEQWEQIGNFSNKQIFDLYSNQTHLWIATDSGVYYFDKKFEKWEHYNVKSGLLSNTVYRLFYFSDYIWALTNKGFCRYSSAMKAWNSYPFNEIIGSSVKYLLVDASYIWVVSPEGVSRFNSKTQAWENFSKNMPIEKVSVLGISTSGTNAWFATDNGVYFFNEDQRRWKTYTSIDGLSDDVQDEIFTTGQTTICRKSTNFSYYRSSEDLWYSSEIKLTAGSAKQAKWKAHIDESGLGVTSPDGKSVNVLGRAYIKVKNKAEFPQPVFSNIGNYITNTNLDSIDTIQTSDGRDSIVVKPRYKDFLYGWAKAQLNLNADLGNQRTLRGTLDNTDPLGERRYSLEYRGFGDDNIKRVGIRSDQKTDYFYSTLIDPTYLEGAGIRTEFGDRVGEKKLRRVNTGLWAGWRKTEYFRKLLNFREDNFYELGIQNIIIESVEIRIDGKLIDPSEYSIERTMGLLTFKNEGIANPDSRIEISCEYQPRINEFPSFRSRIDDTLAKNLGDSLSLSEKASLGIASLENVVSVNQNVQLGINGIYRGIKEPDAYGTGNATNKLYAGSINSKIEAKSKDQKFYFRAIPEISSSYNDSIVCEKQGTAGKIDIYTVFHNLRLKGLTLYQSSQYMTLADQNAVYGRINYNLEGEAIYDIYKQQMPFTIGGVYLDASNGSEIRQYAQYLLSLPNLPSLRLFGMHQSIENQTKNESRDSLKTNRWNATLETQWDLPDWTKTFLLERLWLNASYTLNAINDSVFYDTVQNNFFTVPLYDQKLNHNIFAWILWSPHKKLQFETKNVYRLFYSRNQDSQPYSYAGNRIRPEFKLFSQELIPGITAYGKYLIDISTFVVSLDEEVKRRNHRLNSSLLLVPGVYLNFLNPFQLNLGYNFSKEDTIKTSGIISGTNASLKTMDYYDYAFSIKPMLDFTEDLHFASRTELSNSYNFKLLTLEGLKIYNEARIALWERKTRFDADFNIINETKHYPDTISRIDSLSLKSSSYELRLKWTQRWLNQNFRTELPLNFMWQKLDTIMPFIEYSSGYLNSISPGVLFDARITGKTIKEFRIQYYIGASLTNGEFFNLNTYSLAQENKFDVMVKAGNNFFIRLLLNVNYLFSEKLLKYDMAELKATALF